MRVGRRLFFVAAWGLATLVLAPGALADKQVQGRPIDAYSGDVTMDQGETLTFMNVDLNNHDVTADMLGRDGKPLFQSATIGVGQTAKVEGAEYLTTGSYMFHCTIHPFMMATLNVTSNGMPKPRPGGGTGSGGTPAGAGTADTTAPTVKLALGKVKLSAVRKQRKLPVKVTVSEAAVVNLAAKLGKTTIATGRTTIAAAGSKTASLSLNSAGQKALRGKRSVTLALQAVADDSSGNKQSTSTSAKLRG